MDRVEAKPSVALGFFRLKKTLMFIQSVNYKRG
jgi:hypothetical protein